MGHQVRGMASNPYPGSRQHLAATRLRSPWMERGPQASATLRGPSFVTCPSGMLMIASTPLVMVRITGDNGRKHLLCA